MGTSTSALRARGERGLHRRLRDRLPELEAAVLARVDSISDESAIPEPAYLDGLRVAVAAALEYGLGVVEFPSRAPPPVPPTLLSQARLAARNAVSLEVVLRRYSAGWGLLGDFLIEEAAKAGLSASELQLYLRAQSSLLDRLIASVAEEYRREAHQHAGTPDRHRANLVRRLLEGELRDSAELAYEFDAHHLGFLASGTGGEEAIREIASSLDRRLLLICHEDGTLWAWLGGASALDPERLGGVIGASKDLRLATGEPGEGLSGWRRTHRQAAAALPIALRSQKALTRYADVALLASIAQDELLTASLRELYLLPLARARDGGVALKRTLRAYFAAQRNVSSTAAALGVSRKTVTARLQTIERRLGRSLSSCGAEVEAALRLEEMRIMRASSRDTTCVS